MTTATPTKIRKYDMWGARIEGTAIVGDVIRIKTRAGKEWDAEVTEVVWTGNGTTIVCTQDVRQPSYIAQAWADVDTYDCGHAVHRPKPGCFECSAQIGL